MEYKEEYKQAAFELVEKILLDYNIYSETYTTVVRCTNKTLYEYFESYYNSKDGNVEDFIQNAPPFPNAHKTWVEGLNQLKKKYERGV